MTVSCKLVLQLEGSDICILVILACLHHGTGCCKSCAAGARLCEGLLQSC
jgi:hypothetical protein